MILLEDLLAGAAEAGARLAGPVFSREFQGFAHDSRNVLGGEMFVAVRTERADGHDFIADACRRGAAGILCERPPDDATLAALGATCVVVQDTRRGLGAWATYLLRREAPLVIGVTGSVGKTCATKAIAHVLRTLGDDPRAVFENDNFNDLFGLPISLSHLAPSHQIAVLELASDSAGEIAALCDVTAPQYGVITNVAPAHLEHFGSIARLAEEYRALAVAATERLFLNRDDASVRAMATLPAHDRPLLGGWQPLAAPVTWFGLEQGADVRATDLEVEPLALRFRLHWQGESAPTHVPLPGRHNVHTALAAAAVALLQGHSLASVAGALASLEPPPGRLRPLSGIQNTLLLDDTFSASLPSTLAALDTLAALPEPRIAVLGGDTAPPAELAAPLARTATHVIAVGDAAAAVARAAIQAGLPQAHVAITHTPPDTLSALRSLLEATPSSAAVARGLVPRSGRSHASGEPIGTTLSSLLAFRYSLLVKGTESARLERVVERLLADPSQAPTTLVRQAPGAKQVVPLHQDRAAWMEVDLGAIAGNLARLREIAAPAQVMAVLKADAYGHGAVRVARTALQHDAAMLATAVLSEAAVLRQHGITAPILVLGYTPAWQARDVVRLDVAVSCFSLDAAQHLSRAALALQRPPVPLHVKVDTGMHRLGLLPEEVVPFVQQLATLPGVRIEGLFTHFATADAADPSYALEQLGRFQRLLTDWVAAGLARPRYVHAANSAATLRFPEARFDLVRTGIALYGLQPSDDVPLPAGFAPALSLKTQLAQVKDLPAGEPVSYSATWVTPRPSRIGVLPIGYADGFRRGPEHWGQVLVRGRRVPIVGRVCMDMAMVDVTDVPDARVGDEVVLIGSQGEERLTAEEVAAHLRTINYEVVSQILARVPREIVSR